MQEELRNIFNNLFLDKEGRNFLLRVTVIIIIIISLGFINYFLITDNVDKKNFIIHTNLSRNFLIEGNDPYDAAIGNELEELLNSENIESNLSGFLFRSPVYKLFFYFPFAMIPDISLSLTLWLLINQILFISTVILITKIMEWKVNYFQEIFIIIFCFLSYYSLINLFLPDITFYQLFFLILGIKFLLEDKEIEAGLFLGATSIAFENIFIPFVVIVFIILEQRKFSIIAWYFIAVGTFVLGGIIFDPSWILKMIRNVLTDNVLLSNSYSQFFSNLFPLLNRSLLFDFIPYLMVFWMVIEWGFSKKETKNQIIWLLSLSFCINTLINLPKANYPSIYFNLVSVFVIHLWSIRQHMGYKIIIPLFSIITIVIPYAINSQILLGQQLNNVHQFHLITSIFMLIMLYWIRWWVMDSMQLVKLD